MAKRSRDKMGEGAVYGMRRDSQYGSGTCDMRFVTRGFDAETWNDESKRYEGDEVAALRRAFKRNDWAAFNSYVAEMKAQGWGENRVASIITRATRGRV